MAELSEVFVVTKVAFSRSFSLESVQNANEVILSSNSNGFVRFNMDSMKIAQSWPLSQNQTLNTSCVFHPENGKYYAVIDSTLYSWTAVDSCLSNATVLQMNNSVEIHKLHPVQLNRISDLILIDSQGNASLLSKLDQSVKDSSTKDREEENMTKRYIWSTTMVNNKGYDTCEIAIVTKQMKDYKLSMTTVKEENQKITLEEAKEFVLTPPSKGSRVCSCTVQGNKLIVLWSKNSICSLDLGAAKRMTEKDACLSSREIFTLPTEYKISAKGTSKAKIGKIDSDHIFVVSKCLKEEDRFGIISIINTKFGTKQSSITFPLGSDDTQEHTEEQEILAAHFHAGHVIIALSNSVVASSCQIRSSSLAASIGKLKRPRSANLEVSNTRFAETPFVVTTQLKPLLKTNKEDWMQHFLIKNEKEMKALERLSDPKKTPTIEEFTRELDSYLNKLRNQGKSKQGETQDGDSDEPKIKMKKIDHQLKSYDVIVPDAFTEAVLGRCISDDDFWSGSIIEKVLSTSCISQSLCSELIGRIVEKNSLDIMEKCLEYLTEIREADIVRCLRHILSQTPDKSDPKSITILHGMSKKDELKLDSRCFRILCRILNYPFNDYTMQESLRQLNKQETKKLLPILFNFLAQQSRGADVQISHEKVIDWLSMTINAKFTLLILSNDLANMFKRLEKIVEGQMKLCEQLETIEPYLKYFQAKYTLPQAKKIKAYSVETIIL